MVVAEARELTLMGIFSDNSDMPLEPQQERLYTVGEAAERMGMTRQRIHQLIKDGRLTAVGHGKLKLIPEGQLDTLQERIKPTGRPKKS